MKLGDARPAVDPRLWPLVFPELAAPPPAARQLLVERCDPALAVPFIRAWHSRLPKVQSGPWMFAFVAHHLGTCFGAALWNNPSARTLPGDWLELRRMAVAENAPHCTASRMLGEMRRWIKKNRRAVPRLISYQDTAVHLGTIYKAAGWRPCAVAKARVRDRSKPRVGTSRAYRSNLNGHDPDASEKVRWEVAP